MAEWSPGYILPEQLTGHAVKQVCFDIPDVPEYRQALWGRIWELGEEQVWSKDDPEDDKPRIAAEYWRQVLWETYQRYLASENCEATDCHSYSPGAPFIQWFPNDPYNTPDLVPEGYNNPPWYLATTASNIALGSSTGDVITSIDRFPPGSLPTIIPASGLPRFRVNVSGEGVITLHLVNLFAGSLIQLTKDDDILSVKFIDVSRDTVSIPPETIDAFQVQVEFTTPGLHWVDCIVVSWVNSSIPFLHHGGGLRQVDLCGFTDMPLVPPTMIRSDPSGCGNLEKSTDGGETWTDIDNTDFLRRDGVCAMTGGLEIYPTADEVLLTLKGVGAPYQTAKIMRVQDADGVDRAWINPHGNMVLNQNASGRALELASGSLFMENSGFVSWKNNVGIAKIVFIPSANVLISRSMGSGFYWQDAAGALLMDISDAGNITVKNRSLAGFAITSFIVANGANQGSFTPWRFENTSGDRMFTLESDGRATEKVVDSSTGITDNLILDHQISGTPNAGFGSGIRLRGKSSTTNAQDMARLYAAWETPTHASRAAKVVLSAFDYSGEKVLIEGGVTGASTPKLGFLGATPQPRLAITGDCLGNEATKHIAELLALFGLATDATTLGTAPEPYEPPAPIDVSGDWLGNEAGKNLAIALDGTIINDLTDIGALPTDPTDYITPRCTSTAVIRWLIEKIYYRAGLRMTYLDLAYLSPQRWIDVQAQEFLTGLDSQEDFYDDWAQPLIDAHGEVNSPAVSFADHYTDMVAYIPTLEEAFYCSMLADGVFDVAAYNIFMDTIFDDDFTGVSGSPGTISTWAYEFLKGFNSTDWGIFIAAAAKTEYVGLLDCSAYVCAGDVPDWCKQYNFTLGTYVPPFVHVSGDHVFGAANNPGWATNSSGFLRLEFPFPTIEVTVTYNVSAPDDADLIEVGADAGGGYSVNLPITPGTHVETISIPEANRADGWYFRATVNIFNGRATLKRVDNMTGTGTEPTDLNDC